MSITLAAVPPAAIYREEQAFGWWVYAVLAVLSLVLVGLGLAWAHHGPPPAGVSFRRPSTRQVA